MEGLGLGLGSVKQSAARKLNSSSFQKDLWFIAREGSLTDLDAALLLLKKNGGNINSRNAFGLTPLHIAIWRNNVPIVRRLLATGADPDARDGESGWSSLHRALHFGHLAVASALLQAGASLTLEDSKCRTPVDLLSGPVLQVVGNGHNSVATEVFSWGSGTNYQLGTGNAHIQKLPGKVDALQGSYTKIVAAAKFHSVAVGASGELYTWGFGRGGRLGHPDFDIHSGQAAVITPRQVTLGLGSRRVKAIAAAKHHTIIATEGGEVFTWGSNREGQLGYTSVDSQPTPRRVSSLRTKIVAVAAANKHTAAVSESGEVFTWGCNKEGQLGYGTSNSASNYTPRVVEYLKGKVLIGVSAAKYHTIVLGADGEVFTWGHRLVTPRRVVVARNIKKSGTAPLKFHRMERLHVVSIAAGMIHSTVLTEDGALFYWISSDPDLRCLQEMAIRNLDYIFTVSAPAVASASPEILARLEKSLDAWSSETWSYRRLPTPTATFPAVINSEEEDSESGYHRLRANHEKPMLNNYRDQRADGFLQPQNAADEAISKQVRALRKKLQQIEMLEDKQSSGHLLDDQQIAKLQTRFTLESALVELGSPLETQDKAPSLISSDGKGSKKLETPRKQRRKNKQRASQPEPHTGKHEICAELNSIKGFPDVKTPQFSKEKGDMDGKETSDSHTIEESNFHSPKDILDSPHNSKSSRSTPSKKKNKKGGLSMFLSGALDDAPKEVAPPPTPKTPKSEGPAWGGAKISKGPTSLRDIQNEQSKTKDSQPNRRTRERVEDFAEGGNGGQIHLSSFLSGVPSSPIAVVPARVSPVSDGEKSTPPWVTSGTSPVLSRPSLRDIQMQQEKHHLSISHSPKTRTAGFSVTSSSQGSPSESNGPSRWFRPEVDAPSSIRSIQIEERAMKDLKRFYSSVKLVRNQTQVP
ncbi:uncharacterized protein LOC131249198 isoform X2 [Magnolia sinica]|uniref:uncharacterized protein LOC131249198 isoform X2 n=1 Tax=Magnolia sinica TaxID=86752 RepID=UPI0026581B50|nr:uncharacterized protein LOC131249198 isoform X2 [Magnolia sinica]